MHNYARFTIWGVGFSGGSNLDSDGELGAAFGLQNLGLVVWGLGF